MEMRFSFGPRTQVPVVKRNRLQFRVVNTEREHHIAAEFGQFSPESCDFIRV